MYIQSQFVAVSVGMIATVSWANVKVICGWKSEEKHRDRELCSLFSMSMEIFLFDWKEKFLIFMIL